jgi:hypothetical protein
LRKLSRYSSEEDCSAQSDATEAINKEGFVRFSNKRCVCKTLSHKDYTPEEVEATWYSREECGRIRKQCRKEIKKMNVGEKPKDVKYCSRGLEGHTKNGSACKMRDRALAIDAVLEVQKFQWKEGIFDEEDAIAEVYYTASSKCQLFASLVGQETEEYAYPQSHERSSPDSKSRDSLRRGLQKRCLLHDETG